jgi:RNA polymerase sigma factor (TIGR02999 family)
MAHPAGVMRTTQPYGAAHSKAIVPPRPRGRRDAGGWVESSASLVLVPGTVLVMTSEFSPQREHATSLLTRLSTDPKASSEQLMLMVYEELRALAASQLRRERKHHTLQPTALVHEAYLRLIDGSRVDFDGRTHFFASAAMMIRRVLVDSARSHRAQKRGGEVDKVTLQGGAEPTDSMLDLDVLALDEALQQLSKISPRQGQIVELRFFGGLHVEDVARHLGISERTVRNEWRVARAWLLDKMGGAQTA